MSATRAIAVFLFAGCMCIAADQKQPEVSVHGYIIDSACAFTKGLHKPVSEDCARRCAQAGSPLVVLSDQGEIYWPISENTPAEGQNAKLMPFAGKKVTVTGHVYSRGGSKAIAIEKVE